MFFKKDKSGFSRTWDEIRQNDIAQLQMCLNNLTVFNLLCERNNQAWISIIVAYHAKGPTYCTRAVYGYYFCILPLISNATRIACRGKMR